VYLHFGQQRQSWPPGDFDYLDCIEVMAMPYYFSPFIIKLNKDNESGNREQGTGNREQGVFLPYSR
jgi:hypothetical protein